MLPSLGILLSTPSDRKRHRPPSPSNSSDGLSPAKFPEGRKEEVNKVTTSHKADYVRTGGGRISTSYLCSTLPILRNYTYICSAIQPGQCCSQVPRVHQVGSSIAQGNTGPPCSTTLAGRLYATRNPYFTVNMSSRHPTLHIPLAIRKRINLMCLIMRTLELENTSEGISTQNSGQAKNNLRSHEAPHAE